MSGKYYYKDGNVLDYRDYWRILHREHGPTVEREDGYKAWYIDGKRHRVDGPAIEYANGGKEWYISGILHRLDGPAIEWINGYKSWWIDGKHLTEEQFNNHPKVKHYRFQVLLEDVLSER